MLLSRMDLTNVVSESVMHGPACDVAALETLFNEQKLGCPISISIHVESFPPILLFRFLLPSLLYFSNLFTLNWPLKVWSAAWEEDSKQNFVILFVRTEHAPKAAFLLRNAFLFSTIIACVFIERRDYLGQSVSWTICCKKLCCEHIKSHNNQRLWASGPIRIDFRLFLAHKQKEPLNWNPCIAAYFVLITHYFICQLR